MSTPKIVEDYSNLTLPAIIQGNGGLGLAEGLKFPQMLVAFPDRI